MDCKHQTLDFFKKCNCLSFIENLCLSDFHKRDYSSDKEFASLTNIHPKPNHSNSTESTSSNSLVVTKVNKDIKFFLCFVFVNKFSHSLVSLIIQQNFLFRFLFKDRV